MNKLPTPPAHIEPYVRILGLDAALRFLMAFGGGQIYLPRKGVSVEVAREVGEDAARSLAQAAARLPRRVPTAKPYIAHVLRGQGLSVTEIARRLHSSDVAVRGWLKRDPRSGAAVTEDPRQPRLL